MYFHIECGRRVGFKMEERVINPYQIECVMYCCKHYPLKVEIQIKTEKEKSTKQIIAFLVKLRQLVKEKELIDLELVKNKPKSLSKEKK